MGLLFFYDFQKLSNMFKKNKINKLFNFEMYFLIMIKIREIKNIAIHPNFQNLGYGNYYKK